MGCVTKRWGVYKKLFRKVTLGDISGQYCSRPSHLKSWILLEISKDSTYIMGRESFHGSHSGQGYWKMNGDTITMIFGGDNKNEFTNLRFLVTMDKKKLETTKSELDGKRIITHTCMVKAEIGMNENGEIQKIKGHYSKGPFLIPID